MEKPTLKNVGRQRKGKALRWNATRVVASSPSIDTGLKSTFKVQGVARSEDTQADIANTPR